ncbi:hypothetical protein R3P38DRAFT_3228317 [Favolaschia claudopus]|uniref:Uncharacterized protein n=1 Tax=Favolaschia claudopus TaxID=2862362 RepID=A0AAV9ZQS5_9AGAR
MPPPRALTTPLHLVSQFQLFSFPPALMGGRDDCHLDVRSAIPPPPQPSSYSLTQAPRHPRQRHFGTLRADSLENDKDFKLN